MDIPKNLNNAVFVDTGYWVALLDKSDSLHLKAFSVAQKLENMQVYTSELVFTEVLNHVSKSGPSGRLAAASLIRKLYKAPNVVVITLENPTFLNVLAHYEQMSDKEWGLTDCATFLSMKELNLNQAIAHDKHFAQAGFQALLRDVQ